jgi:hypothetical protein
MRRWPWAPARLDKKRVQIKNGARSVRSLLTSHAYYSIAQNLKTLLEQVYQIFVKLKERRDEADGEG